MSKKKGFEFSFVVFDDQTYKELIVVKPGFEKFTAEILFSMSTGQLATAMLKSIATKFPNEHKAIAEELQRLQTAFISTMQQNEIAQGPVISPLEVLTQRS